MAKRVIDSAIETHLVNNEPFEYAHLVKFERPFHPTDGKFRTNTNRYVYLTDAARDIEFEGNTYKAHQLLTIGNYSETTQAKATNLNLTMPGEYLGTSVTFTGTFAGNNNTRTELLTTTLAATDTFVDGETLDFTELGFKIGDKVSLKRGAGNNFTNDKEGQAVSEKIFIISGFSNNNQTITFLQTGIDKDDSSFLQSNLTSTFILTLLNEEIKGATLEKGTRATTAGDLSNGTSVSITSANSKIKVGQAVFGQGIEIETYVTSVNGTTILLNKTQNFVPGGIELNFTNPSFVNREVFVYKHFTNPETGTALGTVLTFKGILASTNIQEAPGSSKVQWNLKSHWGDFNSVNGRITADEIHRALDSNGVPQPQLAIKPEYATDLGFIHSDTSLNAIAIYETQETRYRTKTKRRGGIAGLFGDKKTYIEEYQVDIQHEVDLSMYLQGKYLPVVYGVQKIPGVPVFADTLNSDPKTIYVAYALAEGEIQGIYNMYIDNNSLLCVDKTDEDVRSEALTDESQALLCYGRMDRGSTLGGTNVSGADKFETWLEENDLAEEYKAAQSSTNEEAEYILRAIHRAYAEANENNIATPTSVSTALGLQHEDSAKINHPFDIDFTFHSGRPDQKASDILVTRANATDKFKRQSDYFGSNDPYWSSAHRLLDTAYVVQKLQIEADQTTIPEVEYVIKGKAIDCYNYDGTFVPDPVYQASTEAAYGGEEDSQVNFKEGDTVTVQTSYDGRNWNTDSTSYRILHSHNFSTARASSHQRFILDSVPNLGQGGVTSITVTDSGDSYTSAPAVSFSGGGGSGAAATAFINSNGKVSHINITNPGTGYTSAPTVTVGGSATATANIGEYDIPVRKFVRLKSSSNKYYHMLPYNSNIQDTPLALDTTNVLPVNSMATDGNGVLTITLSNSTLFDQMYPNASNSSTTSDAYVTFGGVIGSVFSGIVDKEVRVSKSGNVLTALNATFPPNYSSANLLANVTVHASRAYVINGNHEYRKLANGNADSIANLELVGSRLEIPEINESREIVSVDTTNNIVRIEFPFTEKPVITSTSANNHTYKINSKARDLRSSINPAMQTLDMLINKRYGKGLDEENDIAIGTFREAALLCDTRSDVTIPLSSGTNVTAGDVYKLTHDGASDGDHVASGKVLKTESGATAVTFTDVSGKFLRDYYRHVLYGKGDLIRTADANGNAAWLRFTGTSSGYLDSVPTSSTSNFSSVSGSVNLHKVSGSGPSTLPMALGDTPAHYSLYDSDFVKYWRYVGWNYSKQMEVTRHQTNFYFDTSKPIFQNINALLSHYNGILSYSNGKYTLSVETQEATPTISLSNGIQSNPEYIDESDILGSISLNDNSQRTSKNTIKASINDPMNHFGTRSVSFFNSDFLKADRGVVKTGSYPVTGITNYYNARIGIEKELIQSRFSKEITFTIGPKGLLLKAGEVIALTYEPFGFESKLFRIENLTYNSNCNTTVKAREYDDSIYAITEQRATAAHRATSGQRSPIVAPGAPTLANPSTTKPGVISLSWTNASNYLEATDATEIYRRKTTNNISGAELIAVVDNATVFEDPVVETGNFYYWIRHRRESTQTSSNATRIVKGAYANSGTGKLGNAIELSPQLDVDLTAIQFRFGSDGNAVSGQANITANVTLRNITPNATGVEFDLLDPDLTSQDSNIIQFTNNSASLDVASPTNGKYSATVKLASVSSAHINSPRVLQAKVTSDSGQVYTEIVPVTVVQDGTSGSTGIAAAAVKLTPTNGQVITYASDDPDSENPSRTITFTTSLQGNTGDATSAFSGNPFYEFLVNGSTVGSVLSSGTRTIDSTSYAFTAFALPEANEPAHGGVATVEVKVRDGSASGTVKATDSVTVFGIKSGSNAITSFLTNASHVVSADNDGGNPVLTGAEGQFKVFVGTTDITGECTFSRTDSNSALAITLTQSDNDSTNGKYQVTGLTANNATAEFRMVIDQAASPTGQSGQAIEQTFSISKSVKGNTGAGGSDAKTVKLTAANYVVAYDQDGSNPSPSGNVQLTATASNFTDPHFKFTGDHGGTVENSFTDGSGATDTKNFVVPGSFFSAAKVVRVGVSEAADSGTEIAFDSLAIAAVKEGAANYTVVMSNEAHSIPTDTAGNNGNFTGSGTSIRVFKGSNELQGITGTSVSAGQFNAQTSNSASTNIDQSSNTGTVATGTKPVVYADHSNMTADTASIEYTINAEGIQTGLKKIQSFSKSKKGDTGDDGVNTANIKIYKRQAVYSANGPAHPNNDTVYKFSDGTWPVSGDADGWSVSPNDSGNVNTPPGTGPFLWSCSANLQGTSDNITVAESEWTDPILEASSIPRFRLITIYNNGWNGTDALSSLGLDTDYDDDADNTAPDSGMRYNFDTDVFVLGAGNISNGWQTGVLGEGDLPYAIATLHIQENSFGGTQTITSFVTGRQEWDKIPPGGIRLVKDDTNRTLRFAGDSTNNYLGPTIAVSNLYNDQLSSSNVTSGLGFTPLNITGGNIGDASAQATLRAAIGAGTSNLTIGTGANQALAGNTSIFDGNYNNLSNKPTIPTNTNQLTNGAGFFVLPSGSSGQFLKHDGTFGTPPDTNTQLSDAQVRSKVSGSGLLSYNSSTGVFTTTATNNGSTINSSGNVASSITVGSSSKITIDPSNERILIED